MERLHSRQQYTNHGPYLGRHTGPESRLHGRSRVYRHRLGHIGKLDSKCSAHGSDLKCKDTEPCKRMQRTECKCDVHGRQWRRRMCRCLPIQI